MMIPGLLDVKLHVALGLAEGGGTQEWIELQNLYNDIARELDFKVNEDFGMFYSLYL